MPVSWLAPRDCVVFKRFLRGVASSLYFRKKHTNFYRTPLDTADEYANLPYTEQIDQNKGFSYVDCNRITKRNYTKQQEQIRREIDPKDSQQDHRTHGKP